MPQLFPTNDEEWMTHVLNIHGTMFERLCQHSIQQSPNWALKCSRYPVEFPPSYTPQVSQTKNSELDLWGICQCPGIKIELLVECKKNNSDYIDWVFFPTTPSMFPMIRTLKYQRPSYNLTGPWQAERETLCLVTPPSVPVADDGRETKGTYQARWQQLHNGNGKQTPRDFTKTSNAAITEAAYQIALATQALLLQERRNNDALAQKNQPIPIWRQVFLPLIVTTANLWTCQFPAEKVDSATGEIPFNEVVYQKHPYLFFTYALPPVLQYHPADNQLEYKSDEEWEQLARFPILVVQSAAFPDLLMHLSRMTRDDNGRLTLPTLS